MCRRLKAVHFSRVDEHRCIYNAQVAELKAEAAALADKVALLRRTEEHQRHALQRQYEDKFRMAVREHELEMGTTVKVRTNQTQGARLWRGSTSWPAFQSGLLLNYSLQEHHGKVR